MRERNAQLHFNPLGGENLLFQRRPAVPMARERILYVRTRKRLAARLGLNDPERVDFLTGWERAGSDDEPFGRALDRPYTEERPLRDLKLLQSQGPPGFEDFERRVLSA